MKKYLYLKLFILLTLGALALGGVAPAASALSPFTSPAAAKEGQARRSAGHRKINAAGPLKRSARAPIQDDAEAWRKTPPAPAPAGTFALPALREARLENG